MTKTERTESLPNKYGNTFKVGDGVHWGYNGDAYPGTVVKVSDSGRRVYVSEDSYRVIRGNPYEEGPKTCVFTTTYPAEKDLIVYSLRESGHFHVVGSVDRGAGWSLQPGRVYSQNPSF